MAQLTEREQAYFGPRTDKAPGSVAWCWQTILLMKSWWEQKSLNEARYEGIVKELTAHEAWKVVPSDAPYGSLDALMQAEIGCTVAEAKQALITLKNPKKGRQKGRPEEIAQLSYLSQGQRAERNGISLARQKKLDYLAGHAPDLLTAVQEGSLSTHRAYQLAKGLEPATPLDYLHRYWRQVSETDRIQFLITMLTPAERRAILEGIEDCLHV